MPTVNRITRPGPPRPPCERRDRGQLPPTSSNPALLDARGSRQSANRCALWPRATGVRALRSVFLRMFEGPELDRRGNQDTLWFRSSIHASNECSKRSSVNPMASCCQISACGFLIESRVREPFAYLLYACAEDPCTELRDRRITSTRDITISPSATMVSRCGRSLLICSS